MFTKELSVYNSLSTQKSEKISESAYSLLCIYVESYTQYTQIINAQTFLEWLSKYPLAQNSKRTVAHIVGKFFTTFEIFSNEQFSIVKRSFKAKPLDWSAKVIDDERLSKFFYDLEHRAIGEFSKIRDLTAFTLLLVSGVRISQLIELGTDNMKLDDKYTHFLFDAKKQNELSTLSVNTNEKSIPLSAGYAKYNLRKLLENYLDLQKYVKKENYVFVNLAGKQMTSQHFRNVCNNLDPDGNITPHSFRHTAISNVANKHGIYKANVLAGHSNINTTKYYIKPKQEDIEDAYMQSN